MLKEQVLQLLDQALDKNKSLFLIGFSIIGNNQIRVIIDGDNGVTVNDCIAVSREIEHNLDRDEIDFSLDVASAGVSEPLVEIRQYSKNIGRNLKVITSEKEVIEGKLADANDDNITLQWKAREPKPIGKGKVTVSKEAVLPYKDIVEAKVMIKF
ncbi:MAG: ribosome maturation factor RimP [Flavobacteriaceae bacterium]|jgi:ribosome maturation factor RimP|uniref:ribosome assembly cofactor RimP n=1 Tax=Candidatus Marifrigoribacter sp. Uisw_064 TaxID=3230970 RepID=UPI003AE0916C